MAFSAGIPIRKTGVTALALVLSTGAVVAQSYQNLGSYDDWARQSGGDSAPAAAPIPGYSFPNVQYIEPPQQKPRLEDSREDFGDGRDDTILYDGTGRIIGTRDPYGRTRYSSPPIPEPGNDDFDFQRDGRGREGWTPDSDDTSAAPRDDRYRDGPSEPGNDDFDFQRDGRGREGWTPDGDTIIDPQDDGYFQDLDLDTIPEPGN